MDSSETTFRAATISSASRGRPRDGDEIVSARKVVSDESIGVSPLAAIADEQLIARPIISHEEIQLDIPEGIHSGHNDRVVCAGHSYTDDGAVTLDRNHAGIGDEQ